jgi:hypothetical protein
MTIGGPFDELEFSYQQRTKPPAFPHLIGSESLSPPPDASFRQVGKRQAAISNPLKRLINSAREDEVKPNTVYVNPANQPR